MKKRKALSPVIASVLLIALVLVLASIVFLWARGFISEQIEKFGQPVEEVCKNVEFEVDLYRQPNVGLTIEVANRGNVPIKSLDIKEIEGGTSKVHKFRFPIDVGESKAENITINRNTETVKIYPAILGSIKDKQSNKIYTCTEQGVSKPVPVL
ncbi:MAG: archaellin/type IV pilin N-terminal domain-containing protein [Candidatus Nanoarchaeia archaeon]